MSTGTPAEGLSGTRGSYGTPAATDGDDGKVDDEPEDNSEDKRTTRTVG